MTRSSIDLFHIINNYSSKRVARLDILTKSYSHHDFLIAFNSLNDLHPVSITIPCKGYLCGDGTCVNGTRCDGVVQCADGSDELRCKRQSSCHSTLQQWQCTHSTAVGLQCGTRCNEIRDCDDGSDEEECCYNCVGYDAILGNHGSICPRACNGITECDDGSDERDCPSGNNTELPG